MKKKELFVGIIIGSVLTATGAFAVQYVATDNPFSVQLNGQNVNIQGYNIEGSTYFKLRDIADVVGGFTVGFENDTIVLAKDGYTPTQAGGSNEINIKFSPETYHGKSLFVDDNNNYYLKITDANSIIGMDWMIDVNTAKTKWRLEFFDISDVEMYNKGQIYALDGSDVFNGQYILVEDFENIVIPNLSSPKNNPYTKFSIVPDDYE